MIVSGNIFISLLILPVDNIIFIFNYFRITMKNLLLLLVFFSFISLHPQSFKKAEIFVDNITDIEILFKAGMEFDHPEFTKNNSFIAFISEQDYEILKQTGFRYNIMIDDWQKYYESLPLLTEAEKQSFKEQSIRDYRVSGFGFGSVGGHYSLNEVIMELDSMYMLYPDLITQKIQIGTSIQNRPIYAVKISDNPNTDENEPRVLYTGLTHAREPMGMMAIIYFMYYLLENYGTDPEATYLVNNREMYFIPVVNPDGYEHNRSTNPNGGGLWRKNRRDNGGSYGVDLNRNWGPYAYWNAPNGGSSTTPSSDTYRGTAPFSEPEVAAVRDFIAGKNIKNALNYHTYSNLLVFPYGALGRETPDSAIFREFARDMTRFNNYTYGTDLQTVGYSTRGNSDDYMYDGDTLLNGNKIFAMTPEVGTTADGGFWAYQNRIFQLAQDNLYPNLYYAWSAGEHIYLISPNYNVSYFLPGEEISMQPVYKNKGLSGLQNVNFVLTSLSEYVTINNSSVTLNEFPARTEITLPQPFTFNISGNVPLEHNARLLLTKITNGVTLSSDTLSFIVGVPVYTFMDTSNVISTYWTVTATPSTPAWETITTTFYSDPNSYTDSRTGLYVANATVTLTSTNNIDLTGSFSPRLTFWMKHDIEAKWDCGVVQISTNNGSTWTTLQGTLSKAASGSGKQVPAGMPVYDGIRSSWVKEEINLSAYGGQQVKLRFELRTDGSIHKDGWYLDDIGIYYYGVVPVELISFNAGINGNEIMLNWLTATELNNKGFIIERAHAGEIPSEIKDWTNLGFVVGNGTTTEITSYSFRDNAPLSGKAFYRLKQIDFDGTFTYSNPVEVSFTRIPNYTLSQNYPNPFNPSARFSFSLPSQQLVTIRIYDILGSEMAIVMNEIKEAGEYSVELDINKLNLSSGVYFYTLNAGTFTETKKMVVLK
jgi:carboxypeptidase T